MIYVTFCICFILFSISPPPPSLLIFSDLATIVASYDSTAGYTSNALGKWFGAVGGHRRLSRDIVQGWLGRTGESFGGSFGAAIPADLQPSSFASQESAKTCPLALDLSSPDGNFLSTFTMAELVRRLVLHRELPARYRWPGISSFASIQELLYGARTSVLFPGLRWGGLSADTAVYVQKSVNINNVDAQTEGNWRIFSKIGFGRTEVTYNAYACLHDIEFVLSAVGSSGSLSGTDSLMQSSIKKVIDALRDEKPRGMAPTPRPQPSPTPKVTSSSISPTHSNTIPKPSNLPSSGPNGKATTTTTATTTTLSDDWTFAEIEFAGDENKKDEDSVSIGSQAYCIVNLHMLCIILSFFF